MARRPRNARRRSPGQCPCGSGLGYGRCCGPYHRDRGLPPSAEALMRSRYAAYALGLVDYILRTTDPEGAAWEADEEAWRASVVAFSASATFTGVEILEMSPGPGEDEAQVRFRARLEQDGRDASFSEMSRFRLVEGRWLYRDGVVEDEPSRTPT